MKSAPVRPLGHVLRVLGAMGQFASVEQGKGAWESRNGGGWIQGQGHPQGADWAFIGSGQGERSRQIQAVQEICRVKAIPEIGGVTIFIVNLSGFGAS